MRSDHGVPPEQQQQQRGEPAVGVARLAQIGGEPAADRGRHTGRAGEPGGEHEHDPVEDDRLARLEDQRGADVVGGADRRIGRCDLAQRADDEVAGRTAGKEDDDADEDEREADGAQGFAPASAGERDRRRVEEQDERGEHVADLLQEVEALLGGVELARLHDLDRARLRWQLRGHVRQPEFRGHRREHRGEVERHHPAGGRDELALVVDQRDQLALRRCTRVDEELLNFWLGERLGDEVVGAAAKRSGDRASERRELRGKPIGEPCLDVDVVEDPGDDEGVEGRLDVGVLDQLLAGRGPGLGLEQLALGPEREHRHDADHRREDDQDDRECAPRAPLVVIRGRRHRSPPRGPGSRSPPRHRSRSRARGRLRFAQSPRSWVPRG